MTGYEGAFLAFVATSLASIVTYFTAMKKTKVEEEGVRAEEAQIALAAWKELVAPMQEELVRLKIHVERLEAENTNLRERVRELEKLERKYEKLGTSSTSS